MQGQQPADKPSRYLRVQAVGFEPPLAKPHMVQRLGEKVGLLSHHEVPPQLKMHEPDPSTQTVAQQLRRSVNYLGIVPSESTR